VPGHDAEYEEARRAFQNLYRARPVEAVPAPPLDDVDQSISRAEQKRRWVEHDEEDR
jgi:hypothetical protein